MRRGSRSCFEKEHARESLADALRSDNRQVRLDAIVQIDRLGSKAAPLAASVRERLQDSYAPVRAAAAALLAKMIPAELKDLLPLLLAASLDARDDVRHFGWDGVYHGLMKQLEEGVDPEIPVSHLVDLLEAEAPSSTIHVLVASAIGRLGPRAAEAATALSRLLEREEPLLRCAGAAALVRIGLRDEAALKLVSEFLDRPELQLRYSAATALGDAGLERARVEPILVEMAGNVNDCVRKRAAQALERLRETPR